MMRPATFLASCLALVPLLPLVGCVSDDGDDGYFDDDGAGEDGKADGWATSITADNINGLWKGTLDGHALRDDLVIDSWPEIGIQLHASDKVYTATLSGTKLSGTGVTLALHANNSGVEDDAIDGTLDGKALKLVRDVATKPTLTLALPGDRPFRAFMTDLLIPTAQQDRESYTKVDSAKLWAWLQTCELFKAGSWQRKYFKGATRDEQTATLKKAVDAIDGLKTTPHAIIHSKTFGDAINAGLKDPSLAGLALSNFAMYFTTGAGRAIHIPITSKSFAYFITDRPTRADKIGLVVMDTPSHGPLASTFGRQLLDMGAMPASDTSTYAKAMMELLAKSDAHTASSLSGVGQSALTDWYNVMAIEDYRGVAFGNPDLGWGYNMTEVQFFGLVARALAQPDAKDSAGHPILAKVIVGTELKPGDPSYADVLNSGNDMQEYPDMAQLKKLATDYLTSAHPELVTAVKSAFAGIVPDGELDDRAKTDIFHFVGAELYDAKGRINGMKAAAADKAVTAVVALVDQLVKDRAAFEAYILAHGITASNVAATKSTGF